VLAETTAGEHFYIVIRLYVDVDKALKCYEHFHSGLIESVVVCILVYKSDIFR